MGLKFRKAKKEDLTAVLGLIRELAAFEKAPDEVTVKLEELERDGFGAGPLFEIILAEENAEVLGMAFYYYSYSTWKGKCLFLEDIVVREARRGGGIGRALLEAVVEQAKAADAKRVQWQVLNWNTAAIEFYKKFGASVDPAWLNCRFTEKEIKEYKLSRKYL